MQNEFLILHTVITMLLPCLTKINYNNGANGGFVELLGLSSISLSHYTLSFYGENGYWKRSMKLYGNIHDETGNGYGLNSFNIGADDLGTGGGGLCLYNTDTGEANGVLIGQFATFKNGPCLSASFIETASAEVHDDVTGGLSVQRLGDKVGLSFTEWSDQTVASRNMLNPGQCITNKSLKACDSDPVCPLSAICNNSINTSRFSANRFYMSNTFFRTSCSNRCVPEHLVPAMKILGWQCGQDCLDLA
jgi:hypothetical protein